MDTVDALTRSRIMASVGQKNTGAEILLRKALHRIGLRYRLHAKALPGSPDLVFPKYRAVVFVHGCYWHAHGCYRSTMPKSRQTFWREKFMANKMRDRKKADALRESGWRVMTVWECALKGKTSRPLEDIAEAVEAWLRGREVSGEIAGDRT